MGPRPPTVSSVFAEQSPGLQTVAMHPWLRFPGFGSDSCSSFLISLVTDYEMLRIRTKLEPESQEGASPMNTGELIGKDLRFSSIQMKG